jgi:hypothetical protein
MEAVPTLEIEKRNGTFASLAGEGIIQHFKMVEEIPKKNDLRVLNVEDSVKQILDILISANFSSKKMGFCYFTEEYVNEETILSKYLRGSYNTHNIPGGCIFFREGTEHFMECCSMQHMINKNMLDVQYLINNFPKEIKIPRSRRPGDTEDRFSMGNIITNSATIYSTSKGTINIFVEFIDGDKGLMFKTISLNDLMKANGVKMLNIHPLIFTERFMKEQTESVEALLRHYNEIFTSFIQNNISDILKKNYIEYSIEYGSFTF